MGEGYWSIVIRVVLGILVMFLVLFGPAGTLYWPEAWVFLLVYFVWVIPIIWWLKKNDPELLKERMTMRIPGKKWDKLVMAGMVIVCFALFIVAGMDAVRYQWSQVPMELKVLGVIGEVVSLAIFFLVMKENTYLSPIVKIQKKRKHHVITTGPYRYVRHPMYTAAIVLFFSIPLVLGSVYALIPGAMVAVLTIIRTHFEDRMLHQVLPGYKSYAKKTRYRLLPSIW